MSKVSSSLSNPTKYETKMIIENFLFISFKNLINKPITGLYLYSFNRHHFA